MFYQNVPRRGVRNPRELNRTWHVSAVVLWQFRSHSPSRFHLSFLCLPLSLSLSHSHCCITDSPTPNFPRFPPLPSRFLCPSLFARPVIDKRLFCVTHMRRSMKPHRSQNGNVYIRIGNGQLIPHGSRISILPMNRMRKKTGQLSAGLKLHRCVKHRPRSL